MRETLSQIEHTSEYVFHGSNDGTIQVFEPRQAKSFGQLDGPPAVFASDRIDPAIFMAVFGSRNTGGWGKKGRPGFGFYVRRSDWDKAWQEKWTGYVYQFDKKAFRHHVDWELKSIVPIRPLAKFLVELRDLPSDIEIMPDEEFYEYYDNNRPS